MAAPNWFPMRSLKRSVARIRCATMGNCWILAAMPVTVPSALLTVPGALASSGPVSIFLMGSYSNCWVGRCGFFSGVTRLFLFVWLDVIEL